MQVEEKIIWDKKNNEKPAKFRYSMTITNSPLVAKPIKMQDLH